MEANRARVAASLSTRGPTAISMSCQLETSTVLQRCWISNSFPFVFTPRGHRWTGVQYLTRVGRAECGVWRSGSSEFSGTTDRTGGLRAGHRYIPTDEGLRVTESNRRTNRGFSFVWLRTSGILTDYEDEVRYILAFLIQCISLNFSSFPTSTHSYTFPLLQVQGHYLPTRRSIVVYNRLRKR